MINPNFSILYVAKPADSAVFYAQLLERQPIQSSPGFVLFALAGGNMLGLWKASEVEPGATAPGGSELAFALPDNAAVQATHARWVSLGLRIAQPPTDMDFGHCFVALDPDGHRLRPFAPAQA